MGHPTNTLLLVSSLLCSLACQAQTSDFDLDTRALKIPCVALYDNGSPVIGGNGLATTYAVRMSQVPGTFTFSLLEALATTPIDECLAKYDSATGIYTDLVNVGDGTHQVTMARTGALAFNLHSAPLIGPARTSLWKVSKGANTVYLAGTVYALRPSDYPLPKAFDEAYAQASTLYFEIDRDDPVESGSSLTPAQAAALFKDPEGKTLDQVLDQEVYELVVKYLGLKNIAVASVQNWSVQMLMNVVPVDDIKQQIGASADGLDGYLVGKAKADNKPVLGLETAASQRNMLQTINEGLENELVLMTLTDLVQNKSASDLVALLDAWRRGDLSALQNATTAIRTQNRKDYDLVHTERNKAWVTQMEAMLTTPEVEMVVVGATNIAGPEGVLAVLKQRGYTVTKY